MTTYDRPTMILAIALALFLWAYVRVAQELPSTRHLTLEVTIENNGRHSNLSYAITPNNHLDVIVKGQKELLDNLTSDGVGVMVDVGEIDAPGSTNVPVRVRLPHGIELAGKAPSVTVIAKALQQRQFRVVVAFLTAPPAGSMVGEYLVDPAIVTVQGTKEVLDQVHHVIALINPDELLGAAATCVPRPVDAAGERVLDAGVLTSSVKVRMASLTGELVTRQVAVHPPHLTNLPPHLQVTVDKISPDYVTLRGNSAQIDNQPAFLETSPLDVHDVTSDATRSAPLNVPQGMTVIEGPRINVMLHVQPHY